MRESDNMDHSKTGLLLPTPSIGTIEKIWDYCSRLRGQSLANESNLPGRWRVYCVDTFDGTRWLEGQYDTREQAAKSARAVAGKLVYAEVQRSDGRRANSYRI